MFFHAIAVAVCACVFATGAAYGTGLLGFSESLFIGVWTAGGVFVYEAVLYALNRYFSA